MINFYILDRGCKVKLSLILTYQDLHAYLFGVQKENIRKKLIAANIDAALIVQSLGANFNLRRLERYLVTVKESNIEPVVLGLVF
jgi:ribosome biogenesis GTPase